MTAQAATPIAITAVVPLYRVAEYLPDLLTSLTKQAPGDYRLEVIFVDDGSPDESGALAQAWLDETGAVGHVIRQENAGVSAARNAGMDAATGEWITFPDSDDYLSARYFAEVAAFARGAGATATVLSTRLVRLREPERKVRNVHALSFRFAVGNRVVDMNRHPDFFQLNVASAFFRLADLRAAGMRFRTGLHASEDALFVAEFLLGRPDRRLGLVATASYIYRKRAAKTSAIDQYRHRPDSYYERFRDGYAPLLRDAAARGEVPRWLQSMFLYECQWLLPVQLTDEGRERVLDDEGRRITLAALAECARHVEDAVLYRYDATALSLEVRFLLAALAGRQLPSWTPAVVDPRERTLATVTTGRGQMDAGVGGRDVIDGPVEVEFPNYFGQQVLACVSARVSGVPWRVRVDGGPRAVRRIRRRETAAETLDRWRRLRARLWTPALASRAGEVRVWKTVVGPGGDPRLRVRRVLAVARRGYQRAKAARAREKRRTAR